jgi:CRP-like cAMP-binding protein
LQLTANFVLASLSAGDAASIRPFLQPIDLEHKKVLFEAGDSIDHVYFPTGAVISLVIGLSAGEMIEAAMVGRDGVVGAASSLDGRVSLSRAIVQLAGPALVCDVQDLKGAALQSNTFLAKLIRHEQTLYAQAQQSTACMAAHDVESRLCRWLLRARDLAGSDDLMFTQEFLAEMLGVRRTSITVVAHMLQQAGMIKYSRGKIHILNVDGLRDTACECYESVKAHYAQLLGNVPQAP